MSAGPPFLSIVIPFCNSRETSLPLLQALASISAEDGIELILVDDGSVDDTLGLLRAFAERSSAQVRVIGRNRGGPGAARNSGLDQATGKFIWFVDSDDTIDLRSVTLAKKARWPDVDLIAWEWEHPWIVRRMPPGFHSARNRPAPTNVMDPIVCNWFSRAFLQRTRLRFPEFCFFEAAPLESFVLPLLVKDYLKVDFIAYRANTLTPSVTRGSKPYSPARCDCMHTASLGMAFVNRAHVDPATRADFEAAFVRLFLWDMIRLTALPGPSWIRAARMMRHFRDAAQRFRVQLEPMAVYPGRLASGLVASLIWRASALLGPQHLYFDRMRRRVWQDDIRWEPPRMPARWQVSAPKHHPPAAGDEGTTLHGRHDA